MKMVAQINDEYFILSGTQCTQCDANISLYIISINEEMKGESEQDRYTYPGKLYYYEDGSLIGEYRTFYGEVLEGVKGVIWFSKELDEESNWVNSTYLMKLENGNLINDEKSDYDLNLTLQQVEKGLAWEIEGVENTSEP